MATKKKRVAARKTAARKPTARKPAPRRARTRGFPCPDCDFVAKHAMGLGRHRSTRHGAVSQRQQRRQTAGNWLTRQEASKRAGVHYNTIRQWEQAGLLRTARRPRVRGSLVSADDLGRMLTERAMTGSRAVLPVGDVSAVLERRFRDLIEGLERVLAQAKAHAPAKAAGASKKRGRPKAPPRGGRRRARG